MKFYNFNTIYDEYVRSFLLKNKGKYTETQLEDIQPKLFEKFKTQKIKNIGDISVTDYYSQNKDRLIEILKEYLKRNVEPDDFLIEALVNFVETDVLVSYLSPLFDSEFLNVIIKVLDSKGFDNFNVYIELLKSEKTPYETVNAIIDILKYASDKVYKALIESENIDKRVVCEIICESKIRDDAITEFLKNEFLANQDKLVEYLDYIVRYNDESMLSMLYDAINDVNIGYLEFKELKIAIEALGGEYLEKRDFSFDKNYKLLKGEDD